MKHIFLIIALLLTGVLLFSCGNKNRSPSVESDIPTDGGKTDYTNSNAPKSITSNEIVKFHCEISTLDLFPEDYALGGRVFTFEAVLDENNRVDGIYNVSIPYEDYTNNSFEADASFMTALQELVKQYNLAKYNGIAVLTSGLPDRYGATLDVKYASDEYIYASNNEECFIPYEAIVSLEELFRGQLED